MRISDRFVRSLKRLPPNRADAAKRALARFVDQPGLPGLRLRPLLGAPGFFIINSVHGDRIILRKDEQGFIAEDVGPHDNVYRRWDR